MPRASTERSWLYRILPTVAHWNRLRPARVACGERPPRLIRTFLSRQPMQVKRVVPARMDSYESLFRDAGVERSLTHWSGEARRALRGTLAEPRLERAIGVVYRPDTELESHYFEALLSEQCDAWVWFTETTDVTPLPAGAPPEAADLFPSGL